MARRIFPDEGSRLVLASAGRGTAFKSAAGDVVTIYADASGTQLADVQSPAGATLVGSTVVLDTYSRMPLFLGPDNIDTVYVKHLDGPITPAYARVDDRLDQLATETSGALTAHVTAPDPHPQYLRVTEVLIGDGTALTYTVTHGFNTDRITAQVWQTAPPRQHVFPTLEMPTDNTILVRFATPPALNAYKLVVTG